MFHSSSVALQDDLLLLWRGKNYIGLHRDIRSFLISGRSGSVGFPTEPLPGLPSAEPEMLSPLPGLSLQPAEESSARFFSSVAIHGRPSADELDRDMAREALRVLEPLEEKLWDAFDGQPAHVDRTLRKAIHVLDRSFLQPARLYCSGNTREQGISFGKCDIYHMSFHLRDLLLRLPPVRRCADSSRKRKRAS